MNRQDALHLLGERSALQRMIADTPEEEVLDRGSLTARLEEVEYQIAQARIDEREPARARLTFKGRPVIDSHGIFADFSMKAVNSFTEAVTAVAASLTAPLAAMGPIPNREQNQLLITSTALGSFGFELEEYRLGQLTLDDQSTVELALERTQNVLQGSTDPDDELLADSAAELDQRALDKVRAFINTLAENDATCTLQFRNRAFRFTDTGQVRRSLQRMSQDNLHEEEQILKGEFQGVLPKRRTFEFKLQETDEVIAGKIGPAIATADEFNAHLYRTVSVRLMVTRVGNGRPRYLLLETPDWTAGNP
ncbi:MAG TPA: hypothetical protein P5260_09270 [Candidatus Competibacter sp.]|jgi:hypothetical protein|nr:hypothetical protein [Candidatus Competibacter sp.]